ncbi:cytochrome P450 71BT1-like [Lycium ferocissimum]|uniref:cytochrome P450 71BT1-like n=1 Tax=Lycium ferocissimum TaxID=112874 RepID=UPI002814DBF2|nr:cytochrome P450 71BT1-like [Lycium ferocissimum]
MKPIAIYLFASALLILVILKIRTSNSSSNLPPGPSKLPIIGNLHQLAVGGPLIHKVLREFAKKHGPSMHLQFGHVSTIIVSSPETAKQVMETHDIVFAARSQPLSAKIISYDSVNVGFAPYGEYRRQMRKICVLDLPSTKRVQSFRSFREEEFTGLARLLVSHA